MASIGTVSFDICRGLSLPEGMVVEEITRPGVDGVAARQDATRSGKFTVETGEAVAKGTGGADLVTRLGQYYALRGTSQTYTDSRGIASTVIVWDVSCEAIPISGAIGVTTSLADTWVKAAWILQEV